MAGARLEAGWRALSLRRGLAARLLLPLAWLYGALLAERRRAYQSGRRQATRLPVPVVVVGNVVVGGAGKTPTTIALVEHLKARGWRPGVVSRGHGRDGAAPRAVQTGSDPAHSGDEPLLIRRATGVPVWVGRARADAAAALLRAHPEVDLIVCDDGLQHWALASELRVAVFDERGLGNGWLLPAGLLREPWPCTDAPRAPQLVLRQAPEGAPPPPALPGGLPSFAARRALARHAVNARGQRVALDALSHQPVTAVAGIARPEAFFDMLRGRGLRLAATVALGDHADAGALARAVDRAAGVVLCTEKDLVKLTGTPREDLWAVPLLLDIDPAFFAAVDERLGPPRA
jgi:tetraacyldisaccharide 4'-kinase